MPFIRIKTGPNKGKVFEVKESVITIGRDESQTIQILDQGVSRMHSEIFQLGGMCFVRDLNSTNGTFVNNVRVTEEALKAADELLIGTTILMYEERLNEFKSGAPFDERPEGGHQTTHIGTLKEAEAKAAVAVKTGKETSSRTVALTQQLNKMLASGDDLSELLRKSVTAISDAVGADDGYFFMSDAGSGKIQLRAAHERDTAGAERKVSRTIARRILQTGVPLLTSDAAVDERFSLSESVVLRKIKSVIAAPVMVRDRTEGVLYFHTSRTTGTFGVDELDIVTSAALQISILLTNHLLSERLRNGMFSTVRALVNAMETHCFGKQGHSDRVAQYAVAMAEQLGMSADEKHRVRLAALLHDVGKISEIASKGSPTPLPVDGHVTAGEKIIAGIEGFEDLLPGIRYHHERADGSGGPYKIKNDETPLLARIIIVANQFDDLGMVGTAGGPDTLTRMSEGAGKLYDEDVVKALLICHRTGTLYGRTPEA